MRLCFIWAVFNVDVVFATFEPNEVKFVKLDAFVPGLSTKPRDAASLTLVSRV
jgi:hypothetical protein